MSPLETVTFALSFIFTPLGFTVWCIICMPIIGKSLHIRRFYIKLLVIIFEYGRTNINEAKKLHVNFELTGSSEVEHHDIENDSPLSKDIWKILLSRASIVEAHGEPYNGHSLISRDALILVPEPIEHKDHSIKTLSPTQTAPQFDFHWDTCLDYLKAGVEAIIEDDVTSRFEAEELKSWNLLTRTNRYYEFISWRLTCIWICGFIVRYVILLPIRGFTLMLGVILIIILNTVVGFMSEGEIKRWTAQTVLIRCCRLLSSALTSFIRFHNLENRPNGSGICVANHTSPIDVLILMQDNCYSCIAQRHGGLFGAIQRAVGRASPHIWFERAEAKDRLAVTERLRNHVANPKNPPILIFPEGTCINNTSVMQFKKGCFEIGGLIYPVAIKYDPRFGDAFWNSSKYSLLQYLFLVMTSWAIVCDVWYLPPMQRAEHESASMFAERVKGVIAAQGGLIDLVWDGNLKRNKPKVEWKENQQEQFTKQLQIE